MQDRDRTTEQLLSELETLRRRVAELERRESAMWQTEPEGRDPEEKYRFLLNNIEDSIYLVDSKYCYLFMNKAHLRRLGLLGEQFLGQPYRKYHSPQETKEFIKRINQALKTGDPLQYEHKSHRDGKYFLRTLSPVKDPGGHTVAVTIVSKDISEIKRMEQSLRALSLTDELTGLYNRRGFLTLAEQQVKTAKRLRCGMLLLSADLDNLKKINDTGGHQEGDFALTQAAAILKRTFREPDITARMSGDEFAVLMMETSMRDSKTLTSRLQGELDTWNAQSERHYTLSFSIGIAYCAPPFDNNSIDNLLRQADQLMYEQKERLRTRPPGKNSRQRC